MCAFVVFASFTTMAQSSDKKSNPELVALIKSLPTLQEVLKQIELDHPGVRVLSADFDLDRPSDQNRRAYESYDYSYSDGNCAIIMHAYRHTILGIPYGDIYYLPEYVGCL